MSTSAEPKTAPGTTEPQAPRYLPLETVAIRLHGAGSVSGQPVFGILSNISETGCCVITNLPVVVDSAVSLELETERWPEPIAIPSLVIWCAERMEPVKEVVGFLTGLRFESGASAPEALLKSGIFQLIP